MLNIHPSVVPKEAKRYSKPLMLQAIYYVIASTYHCPPLNQSFLVNHIFAVSSLTAFISFIQVKSAGLHKAVFTSAAECHRPFSFLQLCFLWLRYVLRFCFGCFMPGDPNCRRSSRSEGCFSGLSLLLSVVSRLDHQCPSWFLFSKSVKKAAGLLITLSTISAQLLPSCHILGGCSIQLLTVLEPPCSCCFLSLWWVGLSPSLASSVKVIPANCSQVSASVSASLAGCIMRCPLPFCVCALECVSVWKCQPVRISHSEKCCSKHPEHCSNILASDVTKQQLQ